MDLILGRQERRTGAPALRRTATRAEMAHTTPIRFERREDLKPRTVEAIQKAYEAAGVEFANGDAPGNGCGEFGVIRLLDDMGMPKPKSQLETAAISIVKTFALESGRIRHNDNSRPCYGRSL